MSTIEKTISMINWLTESEMLDLQKHIRRVVSARSGERSSSLITEADFIQAIDNSKSDIKQGRLKSWAEVRSRTYDKYGL